jgi:hypothetical protein
MPSDLNLAPGRPFTNQPPRLHPNTKVELEEICRIIAETKERGGRLPQLCNLGNHDDFISSTKRPFSARKGR